MKITNYRKHSRAWNDNPAPKADILSTYSPVSQLLKCLHRGGAQYIWNESTNMYLLSIKNMQHALQGTEIILKVPLSFRQENCPLTRPIPVWSLHAPLGRWEHSRGQGKVWTMQLVWVLALPFPGISVSLENCPQQCAYAFCSVEFWNCKILSILLFLFKSDFLKPRSHK